MCKNAEMQRDAGKQRDAGMCATSHFRTKDTHLLRRAEALTGYSSQYCERYGCIDDRGQFRKPSAFTDMQCIQYSTECMGEKAEEVSKSGDGLKHSGTSSEPDLLGSDLLGSDLLESDPFNIVNIPHPSYEQVLTAVRHNGFALLGVSWVLFNDILKVSVRKQSLEGRIKSLGKPLLQWGDIARVSLGGSTSHGKVQKYARGFCDSMCQMPINESEIEYMLETAIRSAPSVILYVSNPTLRMYVLAVLQEPLLVKKLPSNLDISVYCAALCMDMSILHYMNASTGMQCLEFLGTLEGETFATQIRTIAATERELAAAWHA